MGQFPHQLLTNSLDTLLLALIIRVMTPPRIEEDTISRITLRADTKDTPDSMDTSSSMGSSCSSSQPLRWFWLEDVLLAE